MQFMSLLGTYITTILPLLALTASAKSSLVDYAQLAVGEEKLCNPSGLTLRFTGFRLYQAVLFDWPVRHYWYLVRCNSGKVASQQYFATARTDNFKFGEPVAISADEKYILARRKKYAPRKVPIFRPYSEIGTIYRYCSESDSYEPLAPLYADNTALAFSQKDSGNLIKYLPTLFTSEEEPSWRWQQRQDTNPFEQYSYTDDDQKTVWSRTNRLLNWVCETLTVTSDKVIFWEFDGLEHQLNGIDWRLVANRLVPDI